MLNLWSSLPTLDWVFDDVMRSAFGASSSVGGFAPSVDVREEDGKYLVHVDVPGVKQEDLTIEVDKGILTVRGERKPGDVGDGRALRGRRYGAFYWSARLGDGIDADGVTARLDDGVLRIEVPKLPQAMPRRIQVMGGGAQPQQLGESRNGHDRKELAAEATAEATS